MTATVAVTGMGIAAPNGLGTEAYWQATLAGTGGIDRVSRFDPSSYPATLAGEVPGFDVTEHIPSRLIAQTDHMTRLALAAGDWALADAGVVSDEATSLDMGVITANCAGGFEFGQGELENLWSKGSRYVSAYQSFAWFYAVNSGQLSIRNGLRGPGGVLVSDQAGGLDAAVHARRQIRRGSRLMVTGAVDGAVCPWGWVAQLAGGRLSTAADPARAYLPFDPAASGHVPGEGGALLVLEPLHSARERGAPHLYGEFAGYGASFDPRPGSGRPPGLARAIRTALDDAGVQAEDVDVVFADAAGDRDLDRQEADAIVATFGRDAVPVTAPKTMTGRLGSGGSALDLATALLALRDQVVPPTTNVRPDPEMGLDLVLDVPRAAVLRTALVLARGQGGFNSAVVLRTVS